MSYLSKASLGCENSLSICLQMALQLDSPQHVQAIVNHPDNRNPLFDEHPWYPQSLSHGYPALLLFHSYLARSPFALTKTESAIYNYVLSIKEELESKSIEDLSLFTGLAGICYALSACEEYDLRYAKLTQLLDQRLIVGIEEVYFPMIDKNLMEGTPISTQLYDVIQGIVGIGVYLISKSSQPLFNAALIHIASLLVRMCETINVNGRVVPIWYLPQQFQFLEQDRIAYPNGNFNLGLAHGITGNVCFLSILLLNGIEVPGQKKAIEHVIEWLLRYRQQDHRGVYWPKRISFEHYIANTLPNDESIRDAWCYGTPGISNAIFLAGKALRRPQWIQYSVELLHEVLKRSPEQWDIWRPTFCHGIAGLLAITYRISNASKDPFLCQQVERLKQLLLSFYQETSPFSFQDREPMPSGRQIYLNKAGLLEGACGIGLMLLSLNCSEDLYWDEPFLIHSRGFDL